MCGNEKGKKKKVTLITSWFAAGGTTVIKSHVSVTIVLPRLARSNQAR